MAEAEAGREMASVAEEGTPSRAFRRVVESATPTRPSTRVRAGPWASLVVLTISVGAVLVARCAENRSVATQASGIPTATSLLWFATAVCSALCAAGGGGALLLGAALAWRRRSRNVDA